MVPLTVVAGVIAVTLFVHGTAKVIHVTKHVGHKIVCVASAGKKCGKH